jgi:hypothetical protein
MIVEPAYTEADVLAVQAFAAGKATEAQQLHVQTWLWREVFRMDVDDTPAADRDFEIAHSAGRRFCGMWIKKMLAPGALEAAKNPPKTTKRPK